MIKALKAGQKVETSGGDQGIIRYIGPIHVSDGIFVGIELPEDVGKNDGSVRGERYFTCPPQHGLFIRDTGITRIIAQPAPPPSPVKAPATPRAKPATSSVRPRPSNAIAPKAAPKTSLATKRQSLAPQTSTSSLRAPVRSPSISTGPLRASSIASSATAPHSDSNSRAAAPTSASRSSLPPSRPSIASSRPSIGSTTSQNTSRAARDGNIEALQTRIRHLEKQQAEAQERLKETAHIRDERDRFQNIIQKLQMKCQAQHIEGQELKGSIKTLQDENDRLSKANQEHEVDLEDALIDKEMAEERVDQVEAEVESLQKRIEERDLELDILREEAELFTAEMTEDQKQEAGYYRLQHENDRLRNALVILKEMTEEKEHGYEATILGLEADASQAEMFENKNTILQERITEAEALVENLKQQLDAANEWEEMVGELSGQNQDFQDKIAQQNLIIEDLENLRELNDELELQHIAQEEEMQTELEARDIELVDHQKRITDQDKTIEEQVDLITKFRDLVYDLQSRMTDAESQRTVTEAQAKNNAGKFNKVIDLNRRLRAANVQAVIKEITSSLRTLRADQATEQLDINHLYLETEPREFSASDPLRAYFTAKRITFKASLESTLIVNADRQMSYSGGMDEALSRLSCVEAVFHLSTLKNASERLHSAMAISSLPEFAKFGPTYQELLAIEKAVDQGLDGLKTDEVNFAEMAASFSRCAKIQESVLATHQEVLSELPEDETSATISSIKASLEYLDASFSAVNTLLQFLAANSEELEEEASTIMEKHAPPAVVCKTALLAAQKLVKVVLALRQDSLYPIFVNGLDEAIESDIELAKIARETAAWALRAVKAINLSFDVENDTWLPEARVHNLELFHWSEPLPSLDSITTKLNQWSEHASMLMNSIEIEHGPTPWTQKAQNVEAARKKSLEATMQLQNLTNEHRATLLKIHEREQAIATKELEIEHLVAKNRDISAKAQDVEALQAELAKCHDTIKDLEVQRKTQTLELEALRERAVLSDHSTQNDMEQAVLNPISRAEPIEQPMRALPTNVKSVIDALQIQNQWLRQREQSSMFDDNMKFLSNKMVSARKDEERRQDELRIEDLLEAMMLSESDDESDNGIASQHHQYQRTHKLSALELPPIRLGSVIVWEEDEADDYSMILA